MSTTWLVTEQQGLVFKSIIWGAARLAAGLSQHSYNNSLLLQQDITRGRGMVDSLYQAGGGAGGTHNAVLSSEDYMKQSARNLNNIEDGFYM